MYRREHDGRLCAFLLASVPAIQLSCCLLFCAPACLRMEAVACPLTCPLFLLTRQRAQVPWLCSGLQVRLLSKIACMYNVVPSMTSFLVAPAPIPNMATGCHDQDSSPTHLVTTSTCLMTCASPWPSRPRTSILAQIGSQSAMEVSCKGMLVYILQGKERYTRGASARRPA